MNGSLRVKDVSQVIRKAKTMPFGLMFLPVRCLEISAWSLPQDPGIEALLHLRHAILWGALLTFGTQAKVKSTSPAYDQSTSSLVDPQCSSRSAGDVYHGSYMPVALHTSGPELVGGLGTRNAEA